MTRWFLPSLVALLTAPALAADPIPKPTPEQVEFFEKKVRPVLADNCYSCHGPKKQSAGIRFDTVAGLKAGADDGPIIVPGDAKSRLVKAVTRQGDYPMPPKAALPAEAVAVLTEWVKTGAAYPDDQAIKPGTDPGKHRAFQPVRAPAVPQFRNPKSDIRNEIDAFVLA